MDKKSDNIYTCFMISIGLRTDRYREAILVYEGENEETSTAYILTEKKLKLENMIGVIKTCQIMDKNSA